MAAIRELPRSGIAQKGWYRTAGNGDNRRDAPCVTQPVRPHHASVEAPQGPV